MINQGAKLFACAAFAGALTSCSSPVRSGDYYCNPLASREGKAEIWKTRYGEQIYWAATVMDGEVEAMRLYFDDLGPTKSYDTGPATWRDNGTFLVDVDLPDGWGDAAGIPTSGSVTVVCLRDRS